MPLVQLENYGDFTGDILGETGVAATTNTVSTNLITGVTATKTANKDNWVNGPLTYTVTLANSAGEDFENVVFTDQLDALITLDTEYGVYVNGVKTEDYTFAGNLLTVQIGTIAEGGTATVEFHVLQL